MPQPCSVCTHPQQDAINEALATGAPNRRIAAQYGVTESAIRRHKASGHISKKITKAAMAHERLDATKLLEIMEKLLGEAIQTLKDAKVSRDDRTRLAAINTAANLDKTLLEVMGKLKTAPTVNILLSPQWVEIRSIILTSTEDFPDARARIIEGLSSIKMLNEGGK